MFTEPIIILLSCKRLTKGKWYKPASGLLMFDNVIKVKDTKEAINIINIKIKR